MNKQGAKPKGDWGILGGAFDPIHLGHFNLAQQILDKKPLNGIIFIPSFVSPLKTTEIIASYEQRCKMVELLINENDKFYLSTIEEDLQPPNYTLTTVKSLKDNNPDATFYFIAGSDIFTHINRWHKPNELLKETEILIGARPGEWESESLKKISNNFTTFDIDMKDISSTDIRIKIKDGLSSNKLAEYVGHKVANYILSERVYT